MRILAILLTLLLSAPIALQDSHAAPPRVRSKKVERVETVRSVRADLPTLSRPNAVQSQGKVRFFGKSASSSDEPKGAHRKKRRGKRNQHEEANSRRKREQEKARNNPRKKRRR